MTDLAPIILFTYNRPDHTRQTLKSLKANKEAKDSILYAYSDAPAPSASEQDIENIHLVRELLKEEQWCGTVEIIINDENLGIDYQTPLRINEIFKKHDTIIVLEDDCVLSKGFLEYMNEALKVYENEDKVMHLTGWIPPVKSKLPKLSFVQGLTFNTGWATWKSAWKNYNTNLRQLISDLENADVNKFDLNGAMGSYSYLKNVSEKPLRKQNWDIIWHTSVFLNGGLTLIPGKTLVNNIGFDGSGLHCPEGSDERFGHSSVASSISVNRIEVKESLKTRKVLEEFYAYRPTPSLKDKIRDKLKYEWKKLLGSTNTN